MLSKPNTVSYSRYGPSVLRTVVSLTAVLELSPAALVTTPPPPLL